MNNTYENAFNTIKKTVSDWYKETEQMDCSEAKDARLAVLSDIKTIIQTVEPEKSITNVELMQRIIANMSKLSEAEALLNSVSVELPTSEIDIPINSIIENVFRTVDFEDGITITYWYSTDFEDDSQQIMLGKFHSENTHTFTQLSSIIDHYHDHYYFAEFIDELIALASDDNTPDNTDEVLVDVNALMEKALSNLRRECHLAEMVVTAIPVKPEKVNAKELIGCHRLSMYVSENTVNFSLGERNSFPIQHLPIGSVRILGSTPESTRLMIIDRLPKYIKDVFNDYIEEV